MGLVKTGWLRLTTVGQKHVGTRLQLFLMVQCNAVDIVVVL